MPIALITGSAGLVGAEAVACFHGKGFRVVGIDNDMRQTYFGGEASTNPARRDLERRFPRYVHYDIDIRDRAQIERVFDQYSGDIEAVINTAAQSLHDSAANDPHVDFSVNALGTLNLLECTRRFCPKASFIFTS